MFCPKWCRFIHCSLKKDPNGAVLNDIVGLLLPLDARAGEEEDFLSPAFLSPFLRENSKRRRPKAPTCLSSDPWPTTVWETNRGDVPLWRFLGFEDWKKKEEKKQTERRGRQLKETERKGRKIGEKKKKNRGIEETHRDKEERTESKNRKKEKEKTSGLMSLHGKRSIVAAATKLPNRRRRCEPPSAQQPRSLIPGNLLPFSVPYYLFSFACRTWAIHVLYQMKIVDTRRRATAPAFLFI